MENGTSGTEDDGDIRDGDFPLAGLSIVSNREDEIKRTKFKEKRKENQDFNRHIVLDLAHTTMCCIYSTA
jgi:hypothetical protein